jgi:lipoate-protein ligase A
MHVLDWSSTHPAENLACDEMLLNHAEAGRRGETLRFWESTSYFIVLGIGQVLRDEVNEATCAADAVPILRRCSAGGCVLQGPGCLNYALVLDQTSRSDVATIRSSYRSILGSLSKALARRNLLVHHLGTSDLGMEERKISGNAQRRRKRFILHHGTLLYNFDCNQMQHYLREPQTRPEYRGDRPHEAFVTNLGCTSKELKDALKEEWGADHLQSAPTEDEQQAIYKLAVTKYEDPTWIRRR